MLCQALYQAIGIEEWRDMHGKLPEVSNGIGVEKLDRRLHAQPKKNRYERLKDGLQCEKGS